MLTGCSIKAFEGRLSDLDRKNYHFDCIFDCWRVTIVEKHIRQLPLVTKILVSSSLVLGLVTVFKLYSNVLIISNSYMEPRQHTARV